MWRPLQILNVRWRAERAEAERRAGRYDEAERLLREALALVNERPGLDDATGVLLWNSLGMVHKYQARFGEGARAYLKALRAARRSHGRAPRGRVALCRFASLYHNVGGLEHARGRYRRAEPFARRAAEWRERALGPHHPEVARDVEAWAAILDGLGRHPEAEAMHCRALAVFHARRDRLEFGYASANLAACLHAQGRTGEAEPLLRRAIAEQERRLGWTHPDVGLSLANLAVLEHALGRSDEAEATRVRALAILEAGLGAEHPATVACRADRLASR